MKLRYIETIMISFGLNVLFSSAGGRNVHQRNEDMLASKTGLYKHFASYPDFAERYICILFCQEIPHCIDSSTKLYKITEYL